MEWYVVMSPGPESGPLANTGHAEKCCEESLDRFSTSGQEVEGTVDGIRGVVLTMSGIS